MSAKLKFFFYLGGFFLNIWSFIGYQLTFAATHHPQQFLDKIKLTEHEGLAIFEHFCANCHAKKPVIQLGAPRIGEYEDWQPRIKKGIDVILQHTNEGFQAMPARGGCFECTDEQLVLAVLAMLPNKMRKKFLHLLAKE